MCSSGDDCSMGHRALVQGLSRSVFLPSPPKSEERFSRNSFCGLFAKQARSEPSAHLVSSAYLRLFHVLRGEGVGIRLPGGILEIAQSSSCDAGRAPLGVEWCPDL